MHRPVLLEEVMDWMQVREGGHYVDATLGGGGHAEALLERSGARGRLLGLDADPEAVARCRERLARFGDRAVVVHARFSGMVAPARAHGLGEVDGILLDLGVSSFQLDEPGRGFSFRAEGPLDMRMNPQDAVPARELVRTLGEAELARLLRELGGEPEARRVARRIVRERERAPIDTTTRLAAVVAAAKGGRRGGRHPATRTFQALRIAVNRELEELDEGLEAALALLRPGGRLAVIAFHSLEDRRVKQCFRAHAGRWVSLAEGGRRREGAAPPVRRLTRKPVEPGDAERAENPRSRSARLRVAERREQEEQAA